MPQSETTSPEDGGGLCCCLGSSRDKAHDQPVTLIKSEPITSQPNSQSLASPGEAPMNGIRTKTAEQSIDGFEEVSLEMKTIQQALPASKPTKDHFNITDIHMDALCTEEESGEQIVEDEPDISANVIEEVDEVELKRLANKGFPSVIRDDTKSGERSDEELTFKQMMAEDYERRKKELLKEIESAEEQEREEKEENDSNRSFLNLELESDKASNRGQALSSPSSHQEIQKIEDRPSTSREDSDRDDPHEEMRQKRSVEEEKREIERNRVEQQLMNEIETLDLDEVTDEEQKWEHKRQLSERELKKTDDQFREVVPQLSARSGDETDVEESDDEDDEEEIMVDRHTETLPIHRVPASQMYSKMSESDDESDDEEEREVIVPPPRRVQQKNTVPSSDEDSGKGNTRPDSSSEKENHTQTEAQSGVNDNHVTRVSLKSNGTSTVVVDGESGGVRVSLDQPHHTRSLETQLTDEEFSEKLI